LIHSIWEQVPNIGAHLRWILFDHLRQALTFVITPKKASATGDVALQPLDPNQETLSLREAQSQKRKATSTTLQEEELDQEIRNMEMLHQQVQRKKEKMAWLANLQRQIDEATEEVCHLAQDEQEWRPQHRELHQEGFFNEDG
jgi:flagellar biosynthesis component FlhA